MRKHWKFAIKIVAMALICVLALGLANKVLTPKYYYDNEWPTTTTYTTFYDMEEDTVDVFFLGSSHAETAFIPQYLYENYGIRSYNLSCEKQSMLTSYYWLREALKTQSPSVVVLDTYLLYDCGSGNAVNSPEGCIRKAFDAMRWSSNKWAAVQDICRLDTAQSVISYLLPNVRYHSRWQDLSADDYRFASMEQEPYLMGYAPLAEACEYQGFTPYEAGTSDEKATRLDVMTDYLDRIRALCEENGIELILVKTPFGDQTIAEHNATAEYAEAHGLTFLDYNEAEIYYQSGFDFTNDMADGDHADIWGAQKLSAYMGQYLTEHFPDIAPGAGAADAAKSAKWESRRQYYADVIDDCNLRNYKNISEYIAQLNRERYTILIATSEADFASIDPSVLTQFASMGLTMTYDADTAWCGVNDGGNAVSSSGADTASLTGSMSGRSIVYQISSDVTSEGGGCSILLDGEECATQMGGINIVVYSSARGKVVDSCYYNGGELIHAKLET